SAFTMRITKSDRFTLSLGEKLAAVVPLITPLDASTSISFFAHATLAISSNDFCTYAIAYWLKCDVMKVTLPVSALYLPVGTACTLPEPSTNQTVICSGSSSSSAVGSYGIDNTTGASGLL